MADDRAIAFQQLGAGTDGIWTAGQAREASSRGRVQHLVTSEVWRQVWPGVLADSGIVLDRQGLTRAVCLAGGPGATAYARTAARHWGIPLVDDDDPATGAVEHLQHDVSVTARRVVRTMPDGRVLLPRRVVIAQEEVDASRGYRVTRPLRTLRDLAGAIGHEALVCALDHALHRRLVTLDQLHRQGRARVGTAGAGAYSRALALADGRAESPLETLGRLVLLPAIPALRPQVRVRRGGRVVARLDLADEGVRFGVEADGKSVHGRPDAVTRDRAREDNIGGGWLLSRYTWWDARCGQAAMLAQAVRRWEAAQARL